MTVQQTPELRQNHEYSALVTNTDALLASEFGQTASATWDLVKDEQGRYLLRLTVKDLVSSQQCTSNFAPEEFQDEHRLSSRLHDLKGRLIAG